jgi:uridylate kinase
MGDAHKPAYRRILLKLSGEALLGQQGFGVDSKALQEIGKTIREIIGLGVEVGIVVGGGNFIRGASFSKNGFDRVASDQMGMLATVINGVALRDSFLSMNIATKVMSSISSEGIVETYDRQRAISYLKAGEVVIFVGGTGNPLFTTDSAAALRGIEVGADIVLKATKVDGVYSADPKVDSKAQYFESLSYQEAIERQLGVMDMTAICLCRDHDMLLRVFNMNKQGILKRIVMGENEGTLLTN